MSRRVLVVAEVDPADGSAGKLFALDPGKAVGVPVPAFRSVPSLPPAGSLEGEAVYDLAHKQAFTWTKNSWQALAPSPVRTYATEAALLGDASQTAGTYATAGDTGNLFVARSGGWAQVGIRQYATAAELLAATPLAGALAEALDESSLWERTATGWRLLVVREMADTAAVMAWGKKDPGASRGDRALDVVHDVLYVRTSKGWKPASIWEETEANIRAATWCINGQEAIAIDTGRTMVHINGHWVEEPIAHFATEALLLAAKLPNGTLAWAEDTNVVFTRSGNAWHRLQGPQISVGTTAPTTPGAGDLWFNTDKKLTKICTATTPAIEWQLAGGDGDLKAGQAIIPSGTGTWFELCKGFPNRVGLYRIEVEAGDTHNGSMFVFELQVYVSTAARLRLVESTTSNGASIDKVGAEWFSTDSSMHVSARTTAKAGQAGYRLNVTVRALDGSDISDIVIGGTNAAEPGQKIDVPESYPQLDSGTANGQMPVWNGSRWAASLPSDFGVPRMIGRRDLSFHHYNSDAWQEIVSRWFKPNAMGVKVGNLVMVVMSVRIKKYHDGSVRLRSQLTEDGSGATTDAGWLEYNAAGSAHETSATIERTLVAKVTSAAMKINYIAESYGAGGGNGDRQGWGYIAAWDMGPESSVDL